jgi:tetratricopeptide (TPR) repeat protein
MIFVGEHHPMQKPGPDESTVPRENDDAASPPAPSRRGSRAAVFAAAALLFFVLAAAAYNENLRLSAALTAAQAQIVAREQQNKGLKEQVAALQQQNQGSTARLSLTVSRLQSQLKTQREQLARLMVSETTLQQMPLPVPDWQVPAADAAAAGAAGETGEKGARAIRLLRPVNRAVTDTTPVLESETVPGAGTYSVRLERAGSGAALTPPRQIAPGRWQVTTPLSPGERYQWTVTAARGDDAAPLQSPAGRFYIVSADDQRAIASARGRYAAAPLALGVAYARLGLWDEAAQQFQVVLKATPNHPTARRWLRELQERKN